MILYKYRSFDNLKYLQDIILRERLYCPHYKDLNDPFEGLFQSTITNITSEDLIPQPGVVFRPKAKFQYYGSVEDIENVRICSLSSSLSDVRLWAYYARGYTGVAIAINFDEDQSNLYKVKYLSKLPEYDHTLSRGITLKSLRNPSPNQVLSCKTNHWRWEKEYRFITNSKYISITGKIVSIYVGIRTQEKHITLLKNIVRKQNYIIKTTLNKNSIIIEPIGSNR